MLFSEFPVIDAERWQAQIIAELKGDLEKFARLTRTTDEGIEVRPFYTKKDVSPTSPLQKDDDWRIRQSFTTVSTDFLPRLLTQAAENQTLEFVVNENQLSVAQQTLSAFPNSNIVVESFEPVSKLDVAVEYDPVTVSLFTGNGLEAKPPTAVFGNWLAEAGTSAVQELAYSLLLGQFYKDQTGAAPVLRLSVGRNLLMELAKFRAARLLQASNFSFSRLVGVSAAFNKAAQDVHNNLIRLTLEGVAAAAGGCDSIELRPYNFLLDTNDENGYRWSRNILHLLRYESYFDRVTDPMAGAYFVETLTASLAEQTLNFVEEIKRQGGLIAAIRNGWLQSEVYRVKDQKINRLANGKEILVGVNKYQPKELIDKVGREAPFPTPVSTPSFTVLSPIRAEQFCVS